MRPVGGMWDGQQELLLRHATHLLLSLLSLYRNDVNTYERVASNEGVENATYTADRSQTKDVKKGIPLTVPERRGRKSDG